ncbi:hypothetical protein [Streptomyces sp. NPDC095817]|uniref:hypothetical protein n=1 Tax=Streptomyces sp. NPDC095817 TaxID=3155082 RepID=UPI00332BE0F2
MGEILRSQDLPPSSRCGERLVTTAQMRIKPGASGQPVELELCEGCDGEKSLSFWGPPPPPSFLRLEDLADLMADPHGA